MASSKLRFSLNRIVLPVLGLMLIGSLVVVAVAARRKAAKPAPNAYSPTITETAVTPGDIGCDEIIFVKRKQYSSDHYYTDINNGTSGDRFLPENGIYIYNVRTKKERAVVTAAQLPGGKGFIGKMTLSFDASKVLFDFRQAGNMGFRVWEVGADGKGLRQVSKAPADEAEKVARWRRGWHTDDIHPCYLPSGRIMFSSTRSERTVLCGGSAALVSPTLHSMKADGSDVQQLTASLVSEFCPVVLDDGRVMYHRWEYVDKGARVGKTIWNMHPDGAMPQEVYGGGDDSTTVYMYPQPMPGKELRFVSAGTCHFPQGGCVGAIMLVDPSRPNRKRGPDPDEKEYKQFDDKYAVTNLTPHIFVERRTEPGWHFRQKDGSYRHDRNGTSGHLYTHPWPVSDTTFIVSYKPNPADHYKNTANAYGLYLIDTKGSHRLIHKDANLSCWHATPLMARKTPPEIRPTRDTTLAKRNKALCVVTDITKGMPGVKAGEVKWLRINEAVPRYWATGRRWGGGASSSGWKAALWPRVQWGVVPVEADGSASFEVPADRNIFFQALDKDFREIQRERTYVNYRPGEVRSCVGCHGGPGRVVAPVAMTKPLAMKRAPSKPQAQPCDLKKNGGGDLPMQVIHYPTDIQPIFDAKCVSCHGKQKKGEPAGKLTLTGEVKGHYSTSYQELASKQLAGPILSEFTSFRQGDRGNYNGAMLPPKSLGCYQSTMIKMLTDKTHKNNEKKDHSKRLTPNELMILSRWVDANYQFYGSYYGRRNARFAKEKNFRRKATAAEAVSNVAPDWHK
jgi:hypothetical protein